MRFTISSQDNHRGYRQRDALMRASTRRIQDPLINRSGVPVFAQSTAGKRNKVVGSRADYRQNSLLSSRESHLGICSSVSADFEDTGSYEARSEIHQRMMTPP